MGLYGWFFRYSSLLIGLLEFNNHLPKAKVSPPNPRVFLAPHQAWQAMTTFRFR